MNSDHLAAAVPSEGAKTALPHGECTRSHPHENMSDECERLTVIARQRNAAAARRVRFDAIEANAAGEAWGFNCGPGALCAVLGLSPYELRPKMGDFEAKGYTNPTLMAEVLRAHGVRYRQTYRSDKPGRCRLDFGLMRVQWAGSWTQPGVPMAARYRQTHWVAMAGDSVFDINAICVGGWISRDEWETKLVPWLIREACPKGSGEWWPTHGWELPAPG